MNSRRPQNTLPPLPADNCPFASGRAGGFERCPAFRPVVGLARHPETPWFDVYTHEPAPLVTCAHLTVGVVARGRYYPRCRVGAPTARRRYARAQRGGRRRVPGPARIRRARR